MQKKLTSHNSMKKSNIFSNPEVLRIVGNDFLPQSIKLIDEIKDKLIFMMDKNNWAWVSPQNLVVDSWIISNNDFYKKILVIRNFNGSEYFEILNPSYEMIWSNYVLLHEICWSIETVDTNPLWVLNMVPTKIRVTWFNSLFEKIDFIFEWTWIESQEQISILIHEINHINWKVISDWWIIRKLVKWDTKLYYKVQKLFPELIASYLEFTGTKYVIHSIWESGFNKICPNANKKNKWENILPFHFDIDYDFDLLKSAIINDWKKYSISMCNKCF